MPVTTWINYSMRLLMVLLVITATSTSIKGQMKPRRLDDTTWPPPLDSGVNCGSCSTCENPCYQSPPPPSPPPPSSPYCPPPPPPAGCVTCNSDSSPNITLVLIGCGLVVGLMAFLVIFVDRFKKSQPSCK